MPRFSGLCTTLLALAACSSATTSEQNSAVPIPGGATVTFLGSGSKRTPDVFPNVSNDSIHHMIQRAIKAQLAAKGYTIVDSATPATFVVRYFLGVQSTTAYAPTGGGVSGPPITGIGNGYGKTQDTPLSSMAPPEPVQNVTFEAELVNEKAGRTAWRGIYQRAPKSQAPDQARINKVVADVFTTLPKVP
jgi:hypothetical protein